MESTIVQFRNVGGGAVFVVVQPSPSCLCVSCRNVVGRTFIKEDALSLSARDAYLSSWEITIPLNTPCLVLPNAHDPSVENYGVASARFQMMKLGRERNYGDAWYDE